MINPIGGASASQFNPPEHAAPAKSTVRVPDTMARIATAPRSTVDMLQDNAMPSRQAVISSAPSMHSASSATPVKQKFSLEDVFKMIVDFSKAGMDLIKDGVGVLRDGVGVLKEGMGVLRDGLGFVKEGVGIFKWIMPKI
ncbi:hypothetical protein [Burkholderia ubonensis]|uniref:hypothetical protein n=1 Tax=Burkholderia ubonensis TaxID=101571 RepID=UPI0012FB2200|nr:hypothetical protein [Burkholderia ubonensis]